VSDLYVDLAIPAAISRLFTYRVPIALSSGIQRGIRVFAPFGKKTVVGFVLETSRTSQDIAERGQSIPGIKEISDILDPEPIISDELLELTLWLSDYYMAPIGEVLRAVLVQGAFRLPKRMVILNESSLATQHAFSPHQRAIIQELRHERTLSVKYLTQKLRIKNLLSSIQDLARKGVVTVSEELPVRKAKPKLEQVITVDGIWQTRWKAWIAETPESRRIEKQRSVLRSLLEFDDGTGATPVKYVLQKSGASISTIKSLAKKNVLAVDQRPTTRHIEFDFHQASLGALNIVLNADQQLALESIEASLHSGEFHPFLLYGITGSGKTQVYIEAIRKILSHGGGAIVLVPEISLTPQIVRRFQLHFGETVAVLHSRMGATERFETWERVREGKSSVVIGPRSALFAPIKNLKLIVVDEEHEPSYKQFDQTPRYHARDAAVMRARLTKATVVMGSATPSLESFANVQTGKYTLLELPSRVDNARLPVVDIIDMARERKRAYEALPAKPREEIPHELKGAAHGKTKPGSLSIPLQEKIRDRLQKKEGIILLQNRRGFSPFVECPDCGYVEMCANCNISLTYHLTKRHLRCHYCGTVKQPPEVCPKCMSPEVQYRGFGTQRVEEELRELFPEASVIRMDLDTTTRRGSHDAMLKKFASGEADILLGTQMVAKGLDFSRVTLVGVISADTQMLLPDFRSAERTFQLLTQVAGRAGRSSLAGEVIIQTYQPQHPSLQFVVNHDFRSFFEQELQFRKELHYPPFSRLILLEFRGVHEEEVYRHAASFGDLVRTVNPYFIMLGPASAALAKLKNQFRWHIVIKDLKETDPSGHHAHEALHAAIKSYHNTSLGKSKSVKMIIDIDPVGMM